MPGPQRLRGCGVFVFSRLQPSPRPDSSLTGLGLALQNHLRPGPCALGAGSSLESVFYLPALLQPKSSSSSGFRPDLTLFKKSCQVTTWARPPTCWSPQKPMCPSPCHHITLSPHHPVTTSPCHHIMSPHHHDTTSCHPITMSPSCW